MQLPELLTALGLVTQVHDHPDPDLYTLPRWARVFKGGSAPTELSQLVWDTRTQRVVVLAVSEATQRDPVPLWGATLHEACHAIVGPMSLEDEGLLMPYQWALIQLLRGPHRAGCRAEFADYGLPESKVVGDTSAFTQGRWWRRQVRLSKKSGFLHPNSRPVLGQGAHRGWATAPMY